MNGTLVAAQVESVSTRRDRTLKVVFGLQEVSASKGAELLSLQDKVVALYISAKDTIPERELAQVDAIDVDLPGKSQSQRLRAVLFVWWKADNAGFDTFDTFYKAKTEQYIEHIKSKLP